MILIEKQFQLRWINFWTLPSAALLVQADMAPGLGKSEVSCRTRVPSPQWSTDRISSESTYSRHCKHQVFGDRLLHCSEPMFQAEAKGTWIFLDGKIPS